MEYTEDGTGVRIALAGKRSNGLYTVVSPGDFELVSSWAWRLHTMGYAVTAIPRNGDKLARVQLLHRLIASPAPGQVVDHINADKLDNRRQNLRACTNTENLRNRRKGRGSSQYKGVYRHTQTKNWVAQIGNAGKRKNLGSFSTELEAALCYDAAARALFGDFAHTNF